jgi:hypothetical protein
MEIDETVDKLYYFETGCGSKMEISICDIGN